MLCFVGYGEEDEAAVRVLDSATGQWQTVLQTFPDRRRSCAANPWRRCRQRQSGRQGNSAWRVRMSAGGLNLGWILDSENGELYPVSQKVEGALYETAVMPLALTDDGRFCSVRPRRTAGEEPISAYGIADLRVEDCYSLQPVEDFLQGRTNYTPVTMPE